MLKQHPDISPYLSRIGELLVSELIDKGLPRSQEHQNIAPLGSSILCPLIQRPLKSIHLLLHILGHLRRRKVLHNHRLSSTKPIPHFSPVLPLSFLWCALWILHIGFLPIFKPSHLFAFNIGLKSDVSPHLQQEH